jgi:outer membrane protein TolC
MFDAGRRHAQADQARAAYMENASTYQSTVLAAFREVEDQLSTLRILEDEAVIQDRAVAASQRALDQANNRYRGGVASYLEVTVAQTNSLTNERVAARLASRRMISSVLLLKTIGGSWRVQKLPTLTQ